MLELGRPWRVTMVNKYYPPHLGGVEFHVRDIAEGLVAEGLANVRVLVSNNSSTRAEETVNGVDVVRLPRSFELSSTPFAFGMPGAIASEMRSHEPPDVMHFHFPYPWGELSFLQVKPDVPRVVLYHSDIVRQKLLGAAYRPFLERFLDEMDIIIASSPNMVEHSEFLAPRAEKCRVVNFGLHVERFAGTPDVLERAESLRAQHGGRKIVLFVGRLVYYKGADVLVRAMADVDADLVMIGTGPLEGELREIAVAGGIANRITYLPPQPEAELAAWYHAAEVFCLPSVARSEAFGLVQIEAHAAGTPVVSTNLTTGVPYANLDGVTGLTVPVGDSAALAGALNRVLTDDALRARLGEAAKKRALADFTIPRMCAQTVDVYAEAVERRAALTRKG
jgi:rhamnosyl/mannosyltransferase